MQVIYLSFFILIIDQITKISVKGFNIGFLGISVEGMAIGESINVIGNFLMITFIENPGMAFGIDVGETSKFFLSLFSVLASIGIAIYIYKMRNEKLVFRVALALILAGAMGNLIDRVFYGVFYGYAPLFYGKVVDFINVEFFDFTIFGKTYNRWPIFNIADSAVTVGVFLLIFFGDTSKNKKNENGLIKKTNEQDNIRETPEDNDNRREEKRET